MFLVVFARRITLANEVHQRVVGAVHLAYLR
jgi:hypothetical protein